MLQKRSEQNRQYHEKIAVYFIAGNEERLDRNETMAFRDLRRNLSLLTRK